MATLATAWSSNTTLLPALFTEAGGSGSQHEETQCLEVSFAWTGCEYVYKSTCINWNTGSPHTFAQWQLQVQYCSSSLILHHTVIDTVLAVLSCIVQRQCRPGLSGREPRVVEPSLRAWEGNEASKKGASPYRGWEMAVKKDTKNHLKKQGDEQRTQTERERERKTNK